MNFFYFISVNFYSCIVHVASLWNPKAKKWVNGRKETWSKLARFQASNTTTDHAKTYWFHCASLGEFEQGRPLIEVLKNSAECKIVITFFSPSGYEIRKDYELADLVIYLPVDSKKNAKRFLDLVNPDEIFFVKYEFWANYIFEAERRKIPFYSVSAVFRSNQLFFKWYGGFMRKILKACTYLFVQDAASQQLLESIGVESVLSGDTRYDRVMKNSANAKRFPLIDAFTEDNKIFVCGSLWFQDLQVVVDSLKNLPENWKIIITTHEIDESHLKEAEEFFGGEKIIRYSKLTDKNTDYKILLIDNVGMLMHLYGYGKLAYVGGAFKTGLHNILEPASFGLPVIFGPHHKKFPEAQLFIENGIGFSISSTTEFETVLKKLQTENLREKVQHFMNSKLGATKKILDTIEKRNV